VLLVLTGSEDGTADRIVSNCSLPVFRFNLDLVSDYKVILKPNYWSITNPTGLSISSENASRVFWWKAFSYGLNQDNFFHEEVKYLFREIYSWFGHRSLIVGNPPDTEFRLGKVRQLEVASGFFRIPKTELAIGSNFSGFQDSTNIVKSLTSGLTTTSKAMYTQQVDVTKLDPHLLWYVQEKIDSLNDLTVLVVGEDLFAFTRSRSLLKGLDWRAEQFSDSTPWIFHTLSSVEVQSIKSFCNEIGVRWGRIDFLLTDDGLVFLEINPNGQWVFLDPQDEHKLVRSVVKFLESSDPHGWRA
jgi:hypothetical protein